MSLPYWHHRPLDMDFLHRHYQVQIPSTHGAKDSSNTEVNFYAFTNKGDVLSKDILESAIAENLTDLAEAIGANKVVRMITSSNGNIFRVTGPLCGGIHRSVVKSPQKGQWRGALMFSFICAWINDWVNNREAGDLRRHRAHHDVIVMGLHVHYNISNQFWTIFIKHACNILGVKLRKTWNC